MTEANSWGCFCFLIDVRWNFCSPVVNDQQIILCQFEKPQRRIRLLRFSRSVPSSQLIADQLTPNGDKSTFHDEDQDAVTGQLYKKKDLCWIAYFNGRTFHVGTSWQHICRFTIIQNVMFLRNKFVRKRSKSSVKYRSFWGRCFWWSTNEYGIVRTLRE